MNNSSGHYIEDDGETPQFISFLESAIEKEVLKDKLEIK